MLREVPAVAEQIRQSASSRLHRDSTAKSDVSAER
jgi:hypothetical protein